MSTVAIGLPGVAEMIVILGLVLAAMVVAVAPDLVLVPGDGGGVRQQGAPRRAAQPARAGSRRRADRS